MLLSYLNALVDKPFHSTRYKFLLSEHISNNQTPGQPHKGGKERVLGAGVHIKTSCR